MITVRKGGGGGLVGVLSHKGSGDHLSGSLKEKGVKGEKGVNEIRMITLRKGGRILLFPIRDY